MRMGVKAIMICPELDELYKRRDIAKSIHPSEVLSAAEMRCMSAIEAHASRGHNGKPCP
jgi:hypothetical protein